MSSAAYNIKDLRNHFRQFLLVNIVGKSWHFAQWGIRREDYVVFLLSHMVFISSLLSAKFPLETKTHPGLVSGKDPESSISPDKICKTSKLYFSFQEVRRRQNCLSCL